MKFLNYLMSKVNLSPSINDFIKINKFYVYEDLISFNRLEKILKNNSNMRLLKYAEFNTIIKYAPKIINDSINKLNINSKQKTYFYIADYEGEINKENFFYYQNNKIEKEKVENIKNFKGIGFFKKILTKEESIKNKKYNSLNDLIKNPNIAIYHKEESERDEIICYDTFEINEFTRFSGDFKLPILFAGVIIHDDRFIDKVSQGGSIIDGTAARGDVFGRMTLYPILTLLSKNHIIMPDRDSISDPAKSVWDSFFYKNYDISKEAPIDQYDKPITLSNPLDDGRVYIKDKTIRRDLYEYQKIKNMTSLEQENYLKEIRKDDPYNWTYKLNNYNEVRSILNKLKDRHDKFSETQGNDFIKRLEQISGDFYIKNIA
jgi:hypothetical protein